MSRLGLKSQDKGCTLRILKLDDRHDKCLNVKANNQVDVFVKYSSLAA